MAVKTEREMLEDVFSVALMHAGGQYQAVESKLKVKYSCVK